MTAEALASGISTIATVIDNVMTIVGGNPILLGMFIVPLFGAGIGLVKRLG